MSDFNKGNRRRVSVERLCVCVNLKKKKKESQFTKFKNRKVQRTDAVR